MKAIAQLLMILHVLTTYIESVTQQWRKLATAILSTSHCELDDVRLCAHAQKIIPLAPIHPFTIQKVPSLYSINNHHLEIDSWQSIKLLFNRRSINDFFPSITFLHACRFLLFFLFLFHRTLLRGLVGACMNPGSFSFLFVQ